MLSFTPTEEQHMLVDTISKYAVNDVQKVAHEADEASELPAAVVRKGWEIGLLPAAMPEAFGGLGEYSAVTNVLAAEELAHGDLSVAMAVLAPTRAWLWAAGILIGVFSGPNQAASRSLMGRFTPRDRESEFFGFFAFSGKLASFFGPLLLGVVTQATGSQRQGVATVIAFFLLGGWLLLGVDERRGAAAARV